MKNHVAAAIHQGRFVTHYQKAQNYMKILFILCISCSLFSNLSAQETNEFIPDFATLDYSEPKQYKIGAVNVIGAERRDGNAIKSITGLREGKTITLPSQELTNGIKKLWNLGLFSDVSLVLDSLTETDVYLTIKLVEQPILSRIVFKDFNKNKTEKLTEELGNSPRIGGIVTSNAKTIAANKIRVHFVEKGFLDTDVTVNEIKDTIRENSVVLVFSVDKKDRVKIDNIEFVGNEFVKDRKLRKLMKGTKRKGTFLKKSKFIKEKFEEDKKKIIQHYAKNGYSDALITGDSIWRNDEGLVNLQIKISEGVQYKVGNISWKGNSIYTEDQLKSVLGISKGNIFNPEELSERLEFSLDGRDISSLYMDNGYLFFNIDPKQVAIRKDTIDLEMRIYEGPQATIDRVIIKGNDRTHEHVIRRILRTKPGEKFSRSQIVRSQREIINLGYFDPEALDMQTPVNYERGTVDIIYTVQERPSDQLELSAGYGGFQGLIGTLGVTFNNFSIQNIGNKASWSPLPTGDGQRLSLRIQSNSRFFSSYNFSFTEPWLGGKKPNSFSVGLAASSFDNSSFNAGKLSILRLFAGLGTQLKWPDDFFVSSTQVSIENISLDNYTRFFVRDGSFKNFSISQTISRSSVSNPMFPMSGSKISLLLKFTPPYSLFKSDDFFTIGDSEAAELLRIENGGRGVRNKLEGAAAQDFIASKELEKKFEFLEYHKWRFDAEWYFNPIGKLVFMTQAKMGYLGNYNSAIGDAPFERFELGGDGLSNQNVGIQGTDIVALRGYETEDIDPNVRSSGGGTIFNKFTAELRYPLSTNPNSTIYTSLFFQAGNQWNDFSDYNPFDLKRTVGAGVRVFLPMFGLLGFDYGFGLDKSVDGNPNPSFGALGKFSIILGFEPD